MSSLPQYTLTQRGIIQFRMARADTIGSPPPTSGITQLADGLPKGAVVVGRSAALLHGLDVLPPGHTSATWPVEISVPPDCIGLPIPAAWTCRWSLPPEDTTLLSGVSVTTRERTAWDCARCLPRLEAVAALDQFLRSGVDARSLRIRVDATAARDGRRIASVLDAADPLAQSPGESWTRCLIIDAGLPRPRAQVPVELPDRRVFLDLGYEEYRQGVEYYGAPFHTEEHRRHDAARVAGLAAQGWDIFVVRARDVMGKPDVLLNGLFSRLRRRGWAPVPSHADKVRKRIRYICMTMRRQREAGV